MTWRFPAPRTSPRRPMTRQPTTPSSPPTMPTWPAWTRSHGTGRRPGRRLAVRPEVLPLVVRAYRTMAYVTGTMLVILCFVCVPLRYFAHIPGPAEIVGAFVMTRLVRMKVASVGTIIVLAAGTIPVLTFIVERWVSRTYIAPALAADGVSPSEQPVLR